MQATFDNCNNFNTKLQDTLKGLINANADRKSEIDSLRNDHEDLKKVLSIFNPKIQIFQMQYICSTLVFHSPDFSISRLTNHFKQVPKEKMISAKMKSNPSRRDARKTTR